MTSIRAMDAASGNSTSSCRPSVHDFTSEVLPRHMPRPFLIACPHPWWKRINSGFSIPRRVARSSASNPKSNMSAAASHVIGHFSGPSLPGTVAMKRCCNSSSLRALARHSSPNLPQRTRPSIGGAVLSPIAARVQEMRTWQPGASSSKSDSLQGNVSPSQSQGLSADMRRQSGSVRHLSMCSAIIEFHLSRNSGSAGCRVAVLVPATLECPLQARANKAATKVARKKARIGVSRTVCHSPAGPPHAPGLSMILRCRCGGTVRCNGLLDGSKGRHGISGRARYPR